MIRWRKSSRSSGTAENSCVEIAAMGRAIAVRDSKDPDGPRLHFEMPAWSTFLGAVKADGLPTGSRRP